MWNPQKSIAQLLPFERKEFEEMKTQKVKTKSSIGRNNFQRSFDCDDRKRTLFLMKIY